MGCEITVKLKNHAKTLSKVSYEDQHVTADLRDPIICKRLNSALDEYKDVPEKKIVTIKLIDD